MRYSWMAWTAAAVSVSLAGVGAARAQDAAPDAPVPARVAPKPKADRFKPPVAVTRQDLAVAYLELERALASHPPKGDAIAAVNREFDGLTMLFFSGDLGGAVQRVHELTWKVLGVTPTDAERVARALKVSFVPPVLVGGEKPELKARVTVMYPPVPEAEHFQFVGLLTLEGPGKPPTGASATMKWKPPVTGGTAIDVEAPVVGLGQLTQGPQGAIRVKLNGAECRPLTFAERSLDALRANRLEQLDVIVQQLPASLKGAAAAVQSRIELLTDTPSASNSAQFLSDPIALCGQIELELAALAKGDNPFHDRRGDYWRTFAGENGTQINARVDVPARKDLGAKWPVVFALHGAGGDEAMFMEGYGAGKITALALDKGFIVVSPRTETFGASPRNVSLVLDELAACYPIDRSRVYVLGHSMGAMSAANLAASDADVLAAVCCIAGGPMRAVNGKMAPTLVYGGELDPIIPAKRLEATVAKLKDEGQPVEYRLAPGWGHTLIVGDRLEAAIEWLLTHVRPEPKP